MYVGRYLLCSIRCRSFILEVTRVGDACGVGLMEGFLAFNNDNSVSSLIAAA